jgi:hypothetical protein
VSQFTVSKVTASTELTLLAVTEQDGERVKATLSTLSIALLWYSKLTKKSQDL